MIRGHTSAVALLIIITILFLVPFVNKAFHIDDTLFLWNARQIQAHPLDFYGFSVNWYGTGMPMSLITKNPPFTSYFIAVFAFLFGWSEIALHLAFLLPAIGVAAGSYFLAKRFCSRPFLAACAGIATPVFLVSSTNIMCDTMMLAFWVWAVFFWTEGLEQNRPSFLFISSILVSLCALTKYFGISLIPLLMVYSLVKKRKPGVWVLYFLIPAAVLAGYQWATNVLYGRGLLLDAASYATASRVRQGRQVFENLITGLTFTGGSIAIILFYIPLIWSKKAQWILVASIAVTILLLSQLGMIGKFSLVHNSNIRWNTIIQFGVFAVTGASILALSLGDIWKNRNTDSFLLFLWIAGTFIFASSINWTVNGRSILPMVPAVGILLARRIEHRGSSSRSPIFVWPLLPAAILALLVTWTDYRFAGSARQAAHEINALYKDIAGNRWFQGHWGFQYYMEKEGAKPLNMKQLMLYPGDIMVVPSNNTNIYALPGQYFRIIQTFTPPSLSWISTMHASVGAGFYSDIWGPLPFAFGPVPPEKYTVYLFSFVQQEHPQ